MKELLNERKWNEANNLAKKRYELDPSLHVAPALVQYHRTLIQNEAPIKADEVKDELLAVLSGVSKTAMEVEKYANNLRSSDRPYEAILFYQLAIYYCNDERNVSNIVNCLLRCCAGTSIIIREAIERGDLDKRLIGQHVIPYMKRAKTGIARHLMRNKQEISHALATCLHCFEQCQKEIDDLDGRESSLKEAIALLRNNHGRDVEKKKIFGTCLNNLGHTYLMKRRFEDAIRLFQQAITAKQKAIDYDSPAEKREDVQLSQNGLRAAKSGEVCSIQ